jgi:hypothetical protein
LQINKGVKNLKLIQEHGLKHAADIKKPYVYATISLFNDK